MNAPRPVPKPRNRSGFGWTLLLILVLAIGGALYINSAQNGEVPVLQQQPLDTPADPAASPQE